MRTPASGKPWWIRQRALLAWLGAMLLGVWIAARTTYVADLSAFLPSTPSAEQAVLLEQLHSGLAARLVLIGIEGGDTPARSAASQGLAKSLRDSGLFEAVHNGDNSQFEATGRFLFDHRYVLSPAVDGDRFTVDGLRAAIDDTLSLLGTPAGGLIKPVLWRDPTGETLRMAEGMLPTQAPRSEGGVWASRLADRAVLLATTRADGADLDAQEKALAAVAEHFKPYQQQGLRLIVSGAATFAVASRTQIKSEVERLAGAGGIGVVALLLLAFGGSLRTLATALLPVLSGVFAGIAAVSLGFGHVHGITLGFGTTLIGEAVDYAIYYLIQARPAVGQAAGEGAGRWMRGSWPTVRLGLWTSVCGFAALLFSGFPGLAQLGVFSIAGLCAAALTTRLVLTSVAPDGAPGTALRLRLGAAVAWAATRLPGWRWPLVAVAAGAVWVLVVHPSPWHGDLASLSPVGAARMQQDAELRGDLGASDTGTLVAVAAHTEAEVLAQAEAVGHRLDPLVEAGALAGYESPARLLPSPALQAARRAALPDAATLTARLTQATAGGALPMAKLGGFIADVQAARSAPLLTRASLTGTPLASALDAQLIAGSGTRPWRALLSLQGGAHEVDTARVRQALAGMPGVQVVQIKAELDALYARYLHEAGWQALLGAGAVCVLLLLHLRSPRRLWRLAQPIAAAVAVVLAGLVWHGHALGILHLVGLLLTVAIGSNYALFFDQIEAQSSSAAPDHDTLASLALANLTAVISFGLLAFSSIPALYNVGEVVAPGILLALVFSAAFIPRHAAGARRSG